MYDKEFYEKYARASLEFFYGEKLKKFVLAECPDLQNDTDNIGVEVTRGISQYVGKMSRWANECMENSLTFDQKISRANRMFRKNFLGIIHESGAFVIADPQNGVDSYEIHIREIVEKIKIKVEKLDKLYKKFETNCLYVFTE